MAFATNLLEVYPKFVSLRFNGDIKSLGKENSTFLYKNRIYAPIQDIVTNMDGYIDSDYYNNKSLSINYFPPNSNILTDKNFEFQYMPIQVCILNSKKHNDKLTVISGLLKYCQGAFDYERSDINIRLIFYDKNNKYINNCYVPCGSVKVGEIKYFKKYVQGDLTNYSKVDLHVEYFNDTVEMYRQWMPKDN